MRRLLCIVTAGPGQDELRVRRLTRDLSWDVEMLVADRGRSRLATARAVASRLRARPWDLVLQEGSGVAGGLPLIAAASTRGTPFVLSSGDPIAAFFRTTRGPLAALPFEVYERALYRRAAGFIGWTPYLTTAALERGAARAVTVEGGVDLERFRPYREAERAAAKRAFGLDPGHLVCGIAASLRWSSRQAYCYGLELVSMLAHLRRRDVALLVVGDGDGRARLEARVPATWRDRVVFTGRVAEDQVVRALNAMDVGFITQTLDPLGRARLTTKLPEYLACGLPVAMSPVPGFFDYAREAGWPLPAHHPASETMHRATAAWLDTLTRDEVAARRPAGPAIARRRFGYDILRPRFAAFLDEVAGAVPAGRGGA